MDDRLPFLIAGSDWLSAANWPSVAGCMDGRKVNRGSRFPDVEVWFRDRARTGPLAATTVWIEIEPMSTPSPTLEQGYACNSCGLVLPIRLPLPGEVASSWKCRFCGTRFYATLVDHSPASILGNVQPAEDIHPRIAIGGKVLAEMYRRKDRRGRRFEERHFTRIQSDFALTVVIGGAEMSARAVDLSAGGLGLIAPALPKVMDEIVVRFDSIPGRPAARCIVRNCSEIEPGQFRIGAEFQPAK